MRSKRLLSLLMALFLLFTIAAPTLVWAGEGDGDDAPVSDAGEPASDPAPDPDPAPANPDPAPVVSGSGDDQQTGGSGDDQLTGDNGDDQQTGDNGDNQQTGDNGDDQQTGDDGDDQQTGDSGDDQQTGDSGDDQQTGDSGDDQLTGDNGDDQQTGGSGDDQLTGDNGDDQQTGGSGDDQQTGDNGDDQQTGDSGDDQQTGDNGDDQQTGDSGDDQLTGDDGDDQQTGDSGDDQQTGDSGDDQQTGDDGDDQQTGDDGDAQQTGGDSAAPMLRGTRGLGEGEPTLYAITTCEHVTASPASAAEGAEVTLTVDPDYVHLLEGLTVTQDGTDTILLVTDGVFTMPAGNVTVSATFASAKASIGSVLYMDLSDALIYAATDGTSTTITLCADDTISQVLVDTNKNVTLNLGSCTLNAQISVDSGSALTVTGSGTIACGSGDTITVAAGGALTVNGGTVANNAQNASCCTVNSSGTLTVNGGTVTRTNAESAAYAIVVAGGETTINSGTVRGCEGSAVRVDSGATLTLASGFDHDDSFYYALSGAVVNDPNLTVYYAITADVSPADGGTVNDAVSFSNSFESTEPVALTAVANSGYLFLNWTENGQVVSTDNPYTFDAACDRALTANFEAVQNGPSTGIGIDETTFPDAELRAYVSNNIDGCIDGQKDGILSAEEIAGTTDISLPNCADLTGLAYFTAVETLVFMSGGSFATLDVSPFANLQMVGGYNNNNLTSLVFGPDNTALKTLYISNFQGTSVDLSDLTALTNLRFQNCPNLTAIDLTYNVNLTSLSLVGNALASVDLSQNTELKSLSVDFNQLTALDVSHNTKLTHLTCSSNQLTILNLSNNPLLEYLNCSNNDLATLNIDSNTRLRTLRYEGSSLTSVSVAPDTLRSVIVGEDDALNTQQGYPVLVAKADTILDGVTVHAGDTVTFEDIHKIHDGSGYRVSKKVILSAVNGTVTSAHVIVLGQSDEARCSAFYDSIMGTNGDETWSTIDVSGVLLNLVGDANTYTINGVTMGISTTVATASNVANVTVRAAIAAADAAFDVHPAITLNTSEGDVTHDLSNSDVIEGKTFSVSLPLGPAFANQTVDVDHYDDDGNKVKSWTLTADANGDTEAFNMSDFSILTVTRSSDNDLVTLTLKANNGTEAEHFDQYSVGTTGVFGCPDDFYLDGCYFTGWNTEANGTGTFYAKDEEITLNASLTLYAQWAEITPVYIAGGFYGASNEFFTRNAETGKWEYAFHVPASAFEERDGDPLWLNLCCRITIEGKVFSADGSRFVSLGDKAPVFDHVAGLPLQDADNASARQIQLVPSHAGTYTFIVDTTALTLSVTCAYDDPNDTPNVFMLFAGDNRIYTPGDVLGAIEHNAGGTGWSTPTLAEVPTAAFGDETILWNTMYLGGGADVRFLVGHDGVSYGQDDAIAQEGVALTLTAGKGCTMTNPIPEGEHATYDFYYGATSHKLVVKQRLDESEGVEISTTFPDEVFRAYVAARFDANSDGILSAEEIAAVTVIDLSGPYQNPDDPNGEYTYANCVATLAGIGAFPNLEELSCDPFTFGVDGHLTGVDLSGNTKLKVVDLGCNQLTALDVTMLPDLEELSVGFTNLTSIDLSHNAKLKKLLVDDAKLSALDLTHNPLLAALDCCGNDALEFIDLDNCAALKTDYLAGELHFPDLPYLTEDIHVYGNNSGGEGQPYRLAINTHVKVKAGAPFATNQNPVASAVIYTGDVQTGTLAGVTISIGNHRLAADEAVYQGNFVTVTAPQVLGYTFDGWLDGDTQVSTDPAYTFPVNRGGMYLIAKYRTVGGTTDVTITCINSAQYTVDNDATIKSGGTMQLELGKTLKLAAVNEELFLQWQNGSNKVMGLNKELTVTVTGKMNITLVYKSPVVENQSYVQFVSDYGQVLQSDTYSVSSNFTVPAAPTKFGYTFVKWVFEGTEDEATVETIKAKLGTGTITVKPKYTKDTTTYTLTVVYDGVAHENDAYNNISIGTGYSVSVAAQIGEKVFQHWKLGDTVVSYKTSYYLKVTEDITLTAVYGENAPKVIPVITMSELSTVDANGVHKVTGTATRSIPDGYTLIEHGILYARDYNSPTDNNFIVNGSDVSEYISNTTMNNGTVKLNVKVANDDIVVTFRGYMILLNETTNVNEIFYSDIVSGCYKDLK